MKVSQSQPIGSTEVAQASATETTVRASTRATHAEAGLDAVPKATAGQFAKGQSAPKAGSRALATRVAYADSQLGINEQAWRDYGKAEKKMDQEAKKLTKGWDKLDAKDFGVEQKAFKEYARSSSALRAFVDNEGGSIWRAEAASNAGELVDARVKFLKSGAQVDGHSKAAIPDDAPQQEMNRLVAESYEASRLVLEDLRGKIEPKLDDAQLAMFRVAEKAFDVFRDATSTRAANVEARGGTLAPLIYGSVAEGMTDAHANELWSFLARVSGSDSPNS